MGQVKHVFMTKFKTEITELEIEDFMKAYEKLVDAVETMISVEYGKDLVSANYQQGFTHVFLSTFLNAKAVSDFLVHPAHLAFLEDQGAPKLDNFIVLDYYPIDYPPPSVAHEGAPKVSLLHYYLIDFPRSFIKKTCCCSSF